MELTPKKKGNCNDLVSRSGLVIPFISLLPSLSSLYQLGYQSVLAFFEKKVLHIKNHCKSSKMLEHKLKKIICRSTFFKIW